MMWKIIKIKRSIQKDLQKNEASSDVSGWMRAALMKDESTGLAKVPPPPEIIAQYAKSKTTSLFNKLMDSYVYIDWQLGPLDCSWQYWPRI